MRSWAVLATFVLAGCSLLTDLDGFTSPPGAADAGGSAEGGSSAILTDAGTDANGSSGSDAEVDAGPQTLCSGKHLFCTSFDDVELRAVWDEVANGKGSIARDDGAAVSKPSSLLVIHPAGSLTYDTPRVAKTVAVAGLSGLHCRFQYRRADVDTAGVLVLLMIDFNTATKEHFFAELKDGFSEGRVYLQATAQDGTPHDDFPVVPTVSTSLHDWAAVDWVLDFKTMHSTLRRDTDLLDDRVMPPFDPARVASIKLSLGLGDFTDPTKTWTVRYDDFVCDAL